MNLSVILYIIYLVGSVTFILGLKMLSRPETARRGNLIAAFGMTVAIFGTIFLDKSINNYIWIFGGLFIGTVIGFVGMTGNLSITPPTSDFDATK